LLNPKPPDPEAAFAFPGRGNPAEHPENQPRTGWLPELEVQMSRSLETTARLRPAAFDFDVVTDAPPPREPLSKVRGESNAETGTAPRHVEAPVSAER